MKDEVDRICEAIDQGGQPVSPQYLIACAIVRAAQIVGIAILEAGRVEVEVATQMIAAAVDDALEQEMQDWERIIEPPDPED